MTLKLSSKYTCLYRVHVVSLVREVVLALLVQLVPVVLMVTLVLLALL